MVPSVALTASDQPPKSAQPANQASRWRPLAGIVPAAVLVAIAVWEIAASLRAGRDVPGEAAWQRVAEVVRERLQPGELIVFAPEWIDPVGRMHLGDAISIDMAARMDDARYGTVWELSIRGASAPESRGRIVESSEAIDGIRVRKLVREPAEVVTDFVANFGRAEVNGQAAQRPAVVLAEVGFEPHRCVQIEPRANQTVRVVYRGVRLGSRLVAYAGLADVFTRRDVRDPGRLELIIDGQRAASADLGVGDGWVRIEAATEPRDQAEVVFAATAVGAGAHKRLVCFAAEARR